MIIYETKRLILREWQDKDFGAFSKLNQDASVMEFFPKILNQQDTLKLINKIKDKFNANGFGFYTVILKKSEQLIGSIGLNTPDFKAHFTPCVEIGWRVAKAYWGHGFAVEAAQKCLDIGFNEFNLHEIVSFTAKINKKSERIMQKLGMIHNINDDFYHPELDINDPLALHVLYRLQKI
jgi:RimJ/RimL family protein N-acetyltransferase